VDLEIESNSFPFVQALAELTQIAAAEYEERKDRQNAVDFTDQISYTVDFLQTPGNADVREELREQFEYVMVDEFQDTDPRQWDLIKLLTASDGETFDAQNVFVVGDIKQSIYRFRNADSNRASIASGTPTSRSSAKRPRLSSRCPKTLETRMQNARMTTNFRRTSERCRRCWSRSTNSSRPSSTKTVSPTRRPPNP
jgi:ATP-dependent exoDNAse (exonuclease V) beta subunit